MGKDRYERRHRRTAAHPECVRMMADANMGAAPDLAEAMGLTEPQTPETTMNRLTLSDCGKFVECWHNGQKCHTVPIKCWLCDAVGQGREWFRKRAGAEPTVARDLRAKMAASDSTLTRLAYGK